MPDFFIVVGDSCGARLDRYLVEQLKSRGVVLSRACLQRFIRAGSVSLDGEKTSAHHKVKPGEKIRVTILPEEKKDGPAPENIPLEIVYEDEDVLVLNKPRGLVVHPGAGNPRGTLVNALLFHCPELSTVDPQRPGIVHRLDKDTAGLLVVAKNNPAHLCLSRQFFRHSVRRIYTAIVIGRPKTREGLVDLPIGRHPVRRIKMAVSFRDSSRRAQTGYRVLKYYKNFSLVELYPRTGRTHQLRVHMASLGHPILGDKTYGRRDKDISLALYARYLGFVHPRTKKFLEFEHSLPRDMQVIDPCVTNLSH